MTASRARRGLYGILAGGLLSAAASTATAAPAAHAAPDPCSSSAHAGRLSTTSDRISQYLADNPDVNQRLTQIAQQPPAQAKPDLRTYLNSHPGVARDLQSIRAPLSAQRNQCGMQVPPSNILMGLGSFTSGCMPFGGGLPYGG